MIFFTSDTHFGHANVIEYSRRPFRDIEEMEEGLVEGWNSAVTGTDVVYHLGDFAFQHKSTFPALVSRLRGREIRVIPGNHDGKSARKTLATCRRVIIEPSYVKLKHEGLKLILCHYPIESWDGMRAGSLHLHGHSHGASRPVPNRFDVGVDANNYAPQPLSYFVSKSVASSPRPDRAQGVMMIPQGLSHCASERVGNTLRRFEEATKGMSKDEQAHELCDAIEYFLDYIKNTQRYSQPYFGECP